MARSPQTLPKAEVKTGRRTVLEPRDQTVCFVLSMGERDAVDRVAFSLNITRSGLLAKMVTSFIGAAQGGETAQIAEDTLAELLTEAKNAVKVRGSASIEFSKNKEEEHD